MKRFVGLFCAFLSIWIIGVNPAFSQDLSWTPTGGPYATQVNAFGAQGSTLYAGTNTALYSSTNGGDTWTKNYYVIGIIRDIATKGQNIYVGGSGGVSISTDAGTTWIVRDTGLPQFSLVYSIKNIHDTLYACLGNDGIFQSVDSGKHWLQPFPDIITRVANSMISTGTSIMIAEGLGILRSVNNGFSWDEPTGIISNQSVHTFLVVGTTVFAGTDAGVYKSTDDGATWNVSGTGIYFSDIVTSLAAALDNKVIFAGTSDPNGDVGIYRSNDNGETWSQINSGLSNLSIYSIFATGANKIFTGSAQGISNSTNNGDSWQLASTGLPTVAINSLAPFYTIMYSGATGNFLFESTDAGQLWSQHPRGLTRSNVNAVLSFGATVFAGTDAVPSHGTGGLHRSTDWGNTWAQLKTGIPLMTVNQIIGYGNEIVVSGDSGIYFSKDNGQTWQHNINAIAKTIYANDTNVYAVTTTGTLDQYDKNTGWAQIPNHSLNITSLIKRNGHLFVGTDTGLFKSPITLTDPWPLVTGDTLSVKCIWQNDYLIAVGTKSGIYLSTDNGKTWNFQTSAGKVQINALSATIKDLYAATPTGVIKASLFGYAVHTISQETPSLIHATNPSNEVALIHYTINEPGYTSVTAYDLLGRDCGRIFEGHRDAGEYDLNWDTKSLGSGIYILRLVTSGVESIAKLSIIH